MKKLRTLIALTILSPIQPPVLKGTVRCVDHSTAIQAAKMTDD